MKIIKTANGKQRISMTKSEWLDLGKQAGWVSKAQFETDFDIDISHNKYHYNHIQQHNEKVNNIREMVKGAIHIINENVPELSGVISKLEQYDTNLSQCYMDSGYDYDDLDPRNQAAEKPFDGSMESNNSANEQADFKFSKVGPVWKNTILPALTKNDTFAEAFSDYLSELNQARYDRDFM